jgi:alpha/beta superfamily hydrolase
VLFGRTRSLVGIITDPPEAERDPQRPAIVCLNAGIIHRVGPHRLYVKMARTLAAMGFVVLRFDFSGIGDRG